MPFDPSSFSYRNAFKDDAITASLEGDVRYVSNRIGAAQRWQYAYFGEIGFGSVLWGWDRASLDVTDAAGIAKLTEWTPGRFSTRDALHEPPAVPALFRVPMDPESGRQNILWQQDGPWAFAQCDIALDPVPTHRATKGTAIMGVTNVTPGASATLKLVTPGSPPPSPEGPADWATTVISVSALPGETPVYLRIEIDTHKKKATASKSRTENGRPYWKATVDVEDRFHDLPVWPVWETNNVAAGPGYDGGVDTLPTQVPTGTDMTLTLAADAPPDHSYTVGAVTHGVDDLVTSITVGEFWGGTFPYGQSWTVVPPGLAVGDTYDNASFTPLVAVGETIGPGQALADFVYGGRRGMWRDRYAPVTAGSTELNLLVWRNLGGTLATGDPTPATIPHPQPVVAPPPPNPFATEIPPLTIVPPAGGIGSLLPDPLDPSGGAIGASGTVPD